MQLNSAYFSRDALSKPLFFLSLSCSLILMGCSDKNSNTDKNPHTPPNSETPIGKYVSDIEPLNQKGSGRLLFETTLSPEEISDRQLEFLRSSPILQNTHGIERYCVNTSRGASQTPKSPIIHTYHGVGALVPLAVKLSHEFRWSIPTEMRDQIIKYDIDELDILFTPQLSPGQGGCLKPAHWMFPDRPPIDQIMGSPKELGGTAFMQVFDSDASTSITLPPTRETVQSDALKEFQAFFHDRLLSPDTGHLHIPEESFSFYSLVIFKEQKRAAVTLHWILPHQEEASLRQTVSNSFNDQHSFLEWVNTLNTTGSRFYGTAMMTKLLKLLGQN